MASNSISVEMGQLRNEIVRNIKDNRAETKQIVERLNGRLDEMEVDNQKLAKNVIKLKNDLMQKEQDFKNLEKQLYRPGMRGDEVKQKSMQIKAFEKFIIGGIGNLNAEEMKAFRASDVGARQELNIESKYLRTDSGVEGAYLAPPEYSQEIIKRITEISPWREVCRVRTISRESLMIPMRNVLMQGYWVGEGMPTNEANSDYALNELKTKKLAVFTDATTEMLEDAAFDMEAEITKDAAERFAQLEGEAFTTGDGVNQPDGILLNPDIQVINSGIANSFTADNIIEIVGELKVGYNPAYAFNRRTLAYIRTLKDGVGQYLWQPGIANGYPAQLNGFPYINAINVPDIGADNIPLFFGDFYRGYTIIDRTIMLVIRDAITQATQGKVRFVFVRRVGGQVVMDEAIKFLKCSV
jgi:HK97 family phage major capsid protein